MPSATILERLKKSRKPARALDDDDIPEPASATGQYPGPIWLAASLSDDDEDIPEPPGATGQYPGPVWANGTAVTAQAAMDSPPDDSLLSLKDPDYAEEIGASADPEHDVLPTTPARALTNDQIYRIIREVAVADSGADLYSAISANREFETPNQPGYQMQQFGLGFGLVLFTQHSGRLGNVLKLMKQRDPAQFAAIFGPNAEALLATTNARQPQDRLAAVGGEVLWGPGWVERFRKAGAATAFQAAQNEEAIEGQFRPMLNVALALGFTTDRGLALVYDRVIVKGLGGALRWVVQAVGPLQTGAQRQHALDVLGYDDVFQFQCGTGWTPRDGEFGPETHAAMVGALRRQGDVPMPTVDDLMNGLVQAASAAGKHRLMRLRDSANFTDLPLAPMVNP